MHCRKQKGSRDGLEVPTATEELSSAQLGHPERGKRTERVLERNVLSVSRSGHQTQMNISFLPSPISHPPDEGISDSTGYTGYS